MKYVLIRPSAEFSKCAHLSPAHMICFSTLKYISLLSRACLALPARRERTETLEQWWVLLSFSLSLSLSLYCYSDLHCSHVRASEVGNWAVCSEGLPFGNSTRLLADVFWSLWKKYRPKECNTFTLTRGSSAASAFPLTRQQEPEHSCTAAGCSRTVVMFWTEYITHGSSATFLEYRKWKSWERCVKLRYTSLHVAQHRRHLESQATCEKAAWEELYVTCFHVWQGPPGPPGPRGPQGNSGANVSLIDSSSQNVPYEDVLAPFHWIIWMWFHFEMSTGSSRSSGRNRINGRRRRKGKNRMILSVFLSFLLLQFKSISLKSNSKSLTIYIFPVTQQGETGEAGNPGAHGEPGIGVSAWKCFAGSSDSEELDRSTFMCDWTEST